MVIKIIITESMESSAVAELKAAANVVHDVALVSGGAKLAALVADADALIVRNQTQVTRELLAAAPRLKVVGRLGVGLDNIDTAYCRDHDIKVIPALGTNAVSVVEYVIASALLLTRRCFFSSNAVRAGKWPRAALSKGTEINGKWLGVVGFGSIGQKVAYAARALGMSVAAYDPAIDAGDDVWARCGVKPLRLEALAASADIVSLHVPLLPATRHLVDTHFIGLMKPGAVLINSSRGGVVDEHALVTALRRGDLGGAALDVFESEPLAATDLFEGVENLILTPHVAGVTQESNLRASRMIARAVLDHLAGKHDQN